MASLCGAEKQVVIQQIRLGEKEIIHDLPDGFQDELVRFACTRSAVLFEKVASRNSASDSSLDT